MANWLSGYTTRRKITIDYTKIDDDLTDFPVLVKLTSSNFDFSKANSDGFDVRFTSDNGTTLLKYERERHDATNKLAEYWVKIPSISSTENTEFFVYYKTEDTDDGADPTNVWDSNFKGVWHMKDLTTSTIEDSTSNNNDGAKKASNEPIQADGQIAKAQSFDGTNDYINCGTPTITGTFTVEAWAKVSDNNNRQIVGTRSPNEYSFDFKFMSGNKIHGDIGNGSSWITITADASFSYSLNTWYHIVYVVTTTGYTIYANGNQVGSGSYSSTTPIFSDANHKITIGAYLGSPPSEYFYGTIDEVRISNTNRSAAWIKASYNSGNNSLVSYGNEEGIDNAVFFGCNF